MDDIQKLLFVFDADTSPIEQKFTKVTQGAINAQGAERDAYLQQLGIMQKMRVEAELLRRARDRANDPKAITDYTNRLREVTNQARQLTGALQPKQNTLFDSIKAGLGIGAGFSIVQGLQRAVALTIDLTKATLRSADAARNNRIAIEGIFESRQKALELDKQSKDLDAKSPLNLAKIKEYSLGLAGVDIQFKDIIKDIKAVGDTAAGSGNIGKLENIIYAYKQVAAAGKLMGTEVRQFTEAGVPLIKYLANENGKSMAQIRKDIEDGKVSFEQVRQVFRSLSGDGGKFFNAMEKQSMSLTGQLSMLDSSFLQIQVAIGEKLMPTAMRFVGIANDLAKSIQSIVEVPLSEKLEEEQAALNGLVNAAVSMNDNYEARAALIREIKAEYPDFLAGIDAETVSNGELIKRLKQVNDLYRARISLEVAKETAAPIKEKAKEDFKRQARDRQAAISEIDAALKKKGSSLDTEKLSSLPDSEQQAFLLSERRRAGITGLAKDRVDANINSAFSTNAYYSKQLPELERVISEAEKNVQFQTLQDKKTQLKGAEERLKTAKSERDRAEKGSEEYLRADGIIKRMSTEAEKLRIDYAKAQIERLDAEIDTVNGQIGVGVRAFEGEKQAQKSTAKTEARLKKDRDRLAALIKERAGYESQLPKENNTDPKADKDAAAARKRADAESKKLAEARIKAREDLLKELAKLNFDIAKAEEKDGFQSVERIKKRVAAEIEAERVGFENKKADLVRNRVFSQKEADDLFAPLFVQLKKKESVLQFNEIQKFKAEALKADKENNQRIIDLQLDLQTEKLSLLSESLNKENALINDNYAKQVRDIETKFNDIREKLGKDYNTGLLSVKPTDLEALAEAAKKYENQLFIIDILERKALENSKQAREVALQVLNQKALDEARKANEAVFQTLEVGRSKEEAKQIEAETEKYIRGQQTYTEYQKKIVAIQKWFENLRRKNRVTELEEEIKDIQKRIEATNAAAKGANVDPNLVLNETDLKAAKSEVEKLQIELARLKSELAQAKGETQNKNQDEFKEKVKRFIDGYAAITNAALDAFKTINGAEIESINYSIDAQKNRIEQAKNLRDKGNTEILDEEEKRLRILEERRRKALARQQFLDRLSQLSAVGVGVAKAFAESGGKFTALSIAASISALVAGYSLVNSIVPQPQKFFKGTPFVRRPMGVPTGIDTVPALLTEGERVIPVKENKEYKESLDILTSGAVPAKEAKRRLSEPTFTDLDMKPSEGRGSYATRQRTGYKLNYGKMSDINTQEAKREARKSRNDELLEKQVEQNKVIISLLSQNKPTVNLTMNRKGFALSVKDAEVRESKRNS